jgi:GDPmannose 4,6-dehydratase
MTGEMCWHEDKPDDSVVATGMSHSVRDSVEEVFRVAGLDNWQKYVQLDERFFRPSEIGELVGDAAKAKRMLCWESTIDFKSLVREMVLYDIEPNKSAVPALAGRR